MCLSSVIKKNNPNICVFAIFSMVFSIVQTTELNASSNISNLNRDADTSGSISKLSEIVMNEYVATTPKIDISQTKTLNR